MDAIQIESYVYSSHYKKKEKEMVSHIYLEDLI